MRAKPWVMRRADTERSNLGLASILSRRLEPCSLAVSSTETTHGLQPQDIPQRLPPNDRHHPCPASARPLQGNRKGNDGETVGDRDRVQVAQPLYLAVGLRPPENVRLPELILVAFTGLPDHDLERTVQPPGVDPDQPHA